MPNGHDKNWLRLCIAVEGFRAAYGTWPTAVRIDPVSLADLREHLFSDRAWKEIEKKLSFTPVRDRFEVLDAAGRRYSCREEGGYHRGPEVRAQDWLGVAPDLH